MTPIFKKFLLFFAITESLFSPLTANLIDLEDMTDDFVLELKQIEIPGYPNAFNPSIIRWRGRLLMSFRVIPDRKQSYNSWLGLVWLDDNFSPVGTPQQLMTRNPISSVPSRAEDGRLISIGNRLYFIYSDNEDAIITRGGFRVYIAEIDFRNEKFLIKKIERLSHFEGESNNKREKNWVPFDYQGRLMLAYSIDPHRIFYPLLNNGICDLVSESRSHVLWDWGELRGGTTGLMNDDEYLAFFHSWKDMPSVHSNGRVSSHYFMGAYTYSRTPPFYLTKISPKPIVGKGFYHGILHKPYWKPVHVVFPGGFIQDDQYAWVAYGRQDHECWIVKLDKKRLLESLVPVAYEYTPLLQISDK